MTKIEKIFSTEINKLIFFGSKIAIYLTLGHHKGRPSYRRSLQPSKENIQHFKILSLTFFFLGSVLPSWLPFPMRIRIQRTKINADPCGFGSVSKTLVKIVPFTIISNF
jgi:hypothetical protein